MYKSTRIFQQVYTLQPPALHDESWDISLIKCSYICSLVGLGKVLQRKQRVDVLQCSRINGRESSLLSCQLSRWTTCFSMWLDLHLLLFFVTSPGTYTEVVDHQEIAFLPLEISAWSLLHTVEGCSPPPAPSLLPRALLHSLHCIWTPNCLRVPRQQDPCSAPPGGAGVKN